MRFAWWRKKLDDEDVEYLERTQRATQKMLATLVSELYAGTPPEDAASKAMFGKPKASLQGNPDSSKDPQNET